MQQSVIICYRRQSVTICYRRSADNYIHAYETVGEAAGDEASHAVDGEGLGKKMRWEGRWGCG